MKWLKLIPRVALIGVGGGLAQVGQSGGPINGKAVGLAVAISLIQTLVSLRQNVEGFTKGLPVNADENKDIS